MKSWQTTTLGVIGIVITLLNVAQAYLTGEPVDWGIVMPALSCSAGNLFARDNNKSSKTVGAS